VKTAEYENEFEVNICRRINYNFRKDHYTNDIIQNNKQLLYYVAEKDSIMQIRETILQGIRERGINIILMPDTKGSRYKIFKSNLEVFKELMKTYREILSNWVEKL
jgi:ribosomal protein S12